MGLISAAVDLLAQAFDAVGSGTAPAVGTTAGGAAGSGASGAGGAKRRSPTLGELADLFGDAVSEVGDTLGEAADAKFDPNPTADEAAASEPFDDTINEELVLKAVDAAFKGKTGRTVLGPAGPLLDSATYVKTAFEGAENVKDYNERRQDLLDEIGSSETRGEVQGGDE